MQPTTKEDIRVINQDFASIFNNNSHGMNNSSSNNNTNSNSNNNSNHNSNRPKRVIVCGRRRVTKPRSFNSNSNRCPPLRNTFGTSNNNGNSNSSNNNNNNNNNSRKNNEMNGNRLSKEERLKRKRKFDVMQTGSDELADLMHQAQTNRIPNLTLCYVRKISLPYGICKDDKNDKNGSDNCAVSDKNNSQNNNNNNNNKNSNFNCNNNGNFNFGSFAFETECKIPEKIQADTEKFVNDDQSYAPKKKSI